MTTRKDTENHIQHRRVILGRLQDLGVRVKAPDRWKLEQLHYLHEAVSPIVQRARKAEQELKALRSLQEARRIGSTQWPAPGTPIDDQVKIAERLLHLATVTDGPMVSLVALAGNLAQTYRMDNPYTVLEVIEKWNNPGQYEVEYASNYPPADNG
ncbi:hypothetical protein [Paenibacillus sp. BK720]|uniref:hypothetical protein n=1 Tax=Paenibacillus sp. BK720 TaxID=2587092 RepID=UPI00141F3ADC|nr:hypothetical protein [Paenibacillus sp. BK720]NIK67916.1 hypothetical protein [Paenibacillus sp. BK720]